jgi:hypothetical protein
LRLSAFKLGFILSDWFQVVSCGFSVVSCVFAFLAMLAGMARAIKHVHAVV